MVCCYECKAKKPLKRSEKVRLHKEKEALEKLEKKIKKLK